jgi:peptidoglycan/xylan/chitin deacetylase (PgdA/CDA1 family)
VLAALLADHLLLTAGGLWPRSTWIGPNITRFGGASAHAAPAVALTFDDGPEPAVTPKVLDLLERAGARATFFLIGERAERRPELVRAIVERGHAVGNHTWSHSKAFALLPPRSAALEIDRAQELLATLTGAPPVFFRPPAGIRNVFLEPILARRGLHLASWTRRGLDAFANDADAVYRRLTASLAAGDVLLLHDGQLTRAQRLGLRGEPLVTSVLGRLLDTLAREGLTSVPLTAAMLSPSTLPERPPAD